MDTCRQRQVDRHHGRDKGAQHDAAFGAQVELVGGEHHTNRKAGKDDGDHGGKDIQQPLCLKAEAGLLAEAENGPEQHLFEGFSGGL